MYQVKMLENRLEKAMQRYNAAVARNNGLRQKIDDLRRERLTFDSIYQSLMRDLAEKKRDVAQIMEVPPPPPPALPACAACAACAACSLVVCARRSIGVMRRDRSPLVRSARDRPGRQPVCGLRR